MKYPLLPLVFLAMPAHADFMGYRENLYQPLPSSVREDGLAGYSNPATLAGAEGLGLQFSTPVTQRGSQNLQSYGTFVSAGSLGLGVVQSRLAGYQPMNDFRFAFGTGGDVFSLGFATGWTPHSFVPRRNHWLVSGLLRPLKQVSLSTSYTAGYSGNKSEIVGEFALRPFSSSMLTLFADVSQKKYESTLWSAGGIAKVSDWLGLFGRYLHAAKNTTLLGVSVGKSFEVESHGVVDNGKSPVVLTVRTNSAKGNPTQNPAAVAQYLEIDLEKDPPYLPLSGLASIMSNEKSFTLFQILHGLELAKKAPGIDGVLLRLGSRFSSMERAWELAQGLKVIRAAGKHVVVILEGGSMASYLVASAADKIVTVPYMELSLSGFSSGKTYAKAMLDKLGIAMQEFRFLKYKSALETFTRNVPTDADKEQRQRLVDAFQESWTKSVSQNRPQTQEHLAKVLTEPLFLSSRPEQKNSFVDAVGGKEEIEKIVSSWGSPHPRRIGLEMLLSDRGDANWGPKSRIVVLYANGNCDMETGTRSRDLAQKIKDLASDSSVKGLVLRIDSPGGDPLAAEVVRKALGFFRSESDAPVIVSQGTYAASGGYWMGLASDATYSTPYTITGSIGVISGWIYDSGVGEKLGLKADVVKTGKYADRDRGLGIPLIGEVIPLRPLDKEEQIAVEKSMREIYDEFLVKVGESRKKSKAEVEKIAQGRVWAGEDALHAGLVDKIGGLEDAIRDALARVKDSDVDVEEVLLDDEWRGARSFLDAKLNAQLDVSQLFIPADLRFRLRNNGRVLPMLPMDYIEDSQYK